MIEVGRLIVKIAGRDAGLKGVIVEILDDNNVLIDGQVRRRKCNILHVEPLDKVVKIHKKVDAQQKELPLYETVLVNIGKPIVFNICMLGAVIRLTEIVKPESIMYVLANRIPSSFLDMNQKALNLGMELAEAMYM